MPLCLFCDTKTGKTMSKSMPGCKMCASQFNNIILMASYINWYSVSICIVPKNNMLSSCDVLDLSILNHLRYYFHYIILSICWYNRGVIHGVMIFQHSHVIVKITPRWYFFCCVALSPYNLSHHFQHHTQLTIINV